MLGVTEVDLYTGDMNFIFGQAIPRKGVAIISVHRLKYGLRHKTSEQQIFHKRISKEAVHELGHLIGLSHCENPECVMHFSNTLRDTDKKKTSFCKKCHRTIR